MMYSKIVIKHTYKIFSTILLIVLLLPLSFFNNAYSGAHKSTFIAPSKQFVGVWKGSYICRYDTGAHDYFSISAKIIIPDWLGNGRNRVGYFEFHGKDVGGRTGVFNSGLGKFSTLITSEVDSKMGYAKKNTWLVYPMSGKWEMANYSIRLIDRNTVRIDMDVPHCGGGNFTRTKEDPSNYDVYGNGTTPSRSATRSVTGYFSTGTVILDENSGCYAARSNAESLCGIGGVSSYGTCSCGTASCEVRASCN